MSFHKAEIELLTADFVSLLMRTRNYMQKVRLNRAQYSDLYTLLKQTKESSIKVYQSICCDKSKLDQTIYARLKFYDVIRSHMSLRRGGVK